MLTFSLESKHTVVLQVLFNVKELDCDLLSSIVFFVLLFIVHSGG